ncbi:TPA: LamG domain-containing protein, partial [Candidatus Poribacteria bacterium]|nr:LamG domain-containing protein [Candidatus Poribacteria bacterium]
MKITGMFLLTMIFLIWSANGYGATDETLVLALSFDDGQGKTAKDSSQYSFDGKISGGAKWVKGKFGKALEFDGVDGMVEVADEKELLLLDGGTLMAWVFIKTGKGHPSWPRIGIKSNTNGGTNGYDFLFDRANNYATRFCVGGVCNSYQPVETENWHHVAVTFDGKNIFVYTDGDEVGKGVQAGPAIDTSGSPLHIG